MCGIFGYLGKKNSIVMCIDGLKALEYRGYDSAGIAGITSKGIEAVKQVGPLKDLENKLSSTPLDLKAAIAHTRWATHGKATEENAHPHFDEERTLALVHNGIIENHREVKHFLQSQGIQFYSDTDSEVIAKLISYHYQGDLPGAVAASLKELKGLWAIAVIHQDYPEAMVVASHGTPLAVATSTDETFISSDVNAFSSPANKLFFIKSHELAYLTPGHIQTFDYDLKPLQALDEPFNQQRVTMSKMGFEHYMQKEIFEQPLTLEATLKNRLFSDHVVLDELTSLVPFIQKTRRVVFIGCGTSWHAGLGASLLLERLTSLPTSAVIASELRYNEVNYPLDTLFIAISQSGETMDTLSAVKDLRNKGHEVIALTNVPYSSIEKVSSVTLHLHAGPEISVCSTKAFTSQLTLATLLSLKISFLNTYSIGKNRYDLAILSALAQLPNLAKAVLAQKDRIAQIASSYAQFEKFFFLGRQDMYITALESALKLKEISYAQATAYPGGEMKHGPIALIDEELLTIALLGHEATLEKMQSNLMEIHSRSGPLVILAPQNTEGLADICSDILELPSCHDSLASIPYAIACQLFAYYIAQAKGCPIDKPKNLAKSVTVE